MQDNQNQSSQVYKSDTKYGLFVTILISAWFIAMSIILAGWLIAKEVRNGSVSKNRDDFVDSQISKPVDIKIPESKPRQGSIDAKVTIIEFADFQCPFCAEWHKDIYPKLKKEYIDSGKVNFVYWDFAFLGEESFKTAEAGMCVQEQGKFWEYYDLIFNSQKGENEGTFSDENIRSRVVSLGVDLKRFDDCFSSRIYKPIVEESSKMASEYGVTSTPTLFINKLPVDGVLPWENYKQIIETELAK